MQINVAQLLKQPTGANRSYKIDDVACLVDEGSPSNLQGEVELIRIDRGILVKGILESKINLSCSRCLILFDYHLKFQIDEEFSPATDVVSGISLSLPEDSTGFAIDERHMLELGEAVRQNALLAMPMKPLCRPDCAGLCPYCGSNLNQGKCQCVLLSQKSPWVDLEKLISTEKRR